MSIPLIRSINGASAFYLIVFGQLVSLLGSGLTSFGLSVWVFRETGSTLAYSIVLVAILLPVALGSFFAGPFVDRWDRRRILLLTDTTSALMTLLLALLYTTDQLQIVHVYMALFVSGIALSFQIPAQQAIVPLLVEKDKIDRAAGLSQLPGTVAEIVAPILAGALLVSLGLGVIFIIDFFTFSIGILTIYLVDIPSPYSDTSSIEDPGFVEEFTAGFRYLWVHRPFLYLTGYITMMVFTLGAYYALYPPLILSLATDSVLGLVNTLIGIGSFIGATLLGVWKFDKRVRAILVAGLLMSLGGIIAGMQPNLFSIVPGLVLAFSTFPFLIGMNRALYQLKAPQSLLGRIFAFRLAVGTFAQTIGALLAGFIAEHIVESVAISTIDESQGIASTFLLIGCVSLLGTLIAATLQPLRQLEQRLPDF